jgi:FKBP-type peptidyl-prolyl cis-trans isomerase
MATLTLAIGLALGGGARAETTRPGPSAVDPRTSEEKVLYVLGLHQAQELRNFELTEAERQLVWAGFSDALFGHPEKAPLALWGDRIGRLEQRRIEQTAQRERQAAQPYLEQAARAPGARRRSSGLIYREIRAGDGASPEARDRVKVHYRGRLLDGTEFDSSYARKAPAEFPLDQVIRCWTEGLQLMRVGGKAELVCPDTIAYGLRGSLGKIKPGATLVFEVELLDVLAPGPAARAR